MVSNKYNHCNLRASPLIYSGAILICKNHISDKSVDMKVKEIDVTANIAWSPLSVSPVRLAAGTAAQQLDATFSTNSALEIYDLNLGEDGSSMKKIGSIPTENRFHKIVWGQGGVVNQENNR